MNKADISQTISQIDLNYIQEAMEADKVLLNGKGKEKQMWRFHKAHRFIEEILEGYTGTTDITAMGLQDMVIKYEDVMYVFSVEGDVLVMDVDGGKVSIPRTQIELSYEDLETLLNIFSNYGV